MMNNDKEFAKAPPHEKVKLLKLAIIDDFSSILGGLTKIGSTLMNGVTKYAPKLFDFMSSANTLDKLATVSDNLGMVKGAMDMFKNTPAVVNN